MDLKRFKRKYFAEGVRLGYKKFLKEFMDYHGPNGSLFVAGNNKDLDEIKNAIESEFGVNVTMGNGEDYMYVTGYDRNIQQELKDLIETDFGIRTDVLEVGGKKLKVRLRQF